MTGWKPTQASSVITTSTMLASMPPKCVNGTARSSAAIVPAMPAESTPAARNSDISPPISGSRTVTSRRSEAAARLPSRTSSVTVVISGAIAAMTASTDHAGLTSCTASTPSASAAGTHSASKCTG